MCQNNTSQYSRAHALRARAERTRTRTRPLPPRPTDRTNGGARRACLRLVADSCTMLRHYLINLMQAPCAEEAVATARIEHARVHPLGFARKGVAAATGVVGVRRAASPRQNFINHSVARNSQFCKDFRLRMCRHVCVFVCHVLGDIWRRTVG